MVCGGVANAQVIVERWRRHDSEERPHSALGYRTLAEGNCRAEGPVLAASEPAASRTVGGRPGFAS